MNYYEAIKARALYNVLQPDTEYYLRRIYRWYSKTFHTPLQEAFDIPIEFVLTEYFEEYFEEATEDEREEIIAELLETPEQKKQRLTQKEADSIAEQDLLEMSRKSNEAANEAALKDKLKKISEIAQPKRSVSIPQKIDQLANTIKEAGESIKEAMKSDPPELEEINMAFESDADFEKLLNQDSNIMSVTDPKDKKP